MVVVVVMEVMVAEEGKVSVMGHSIVLAGHSK
jgi:hypothetical protein